LLVTDINVSYNKTQTSNAWIISAFRSKMIISIYTLLFPHSPLWHDNGAKHKLPWWSNTKTSHQFTLQSKSHEQYHMIHLSSLVTCYYRHSKACCITNISVEWQCLCLAFLCSIQHNGDGVVYFWHQYYTLPACHVVYCIPSTKWISTIFNINYHNAQSFSILQILNTTKIIIQDLKCLLRLLHVEKISKFNLKQI
jgi:hypothetical protein